MTHWVQLNGKMVKMKNAKFTFCPAGRRIRRWHKFITGTIRGILVTICLSVAKIVNVIRSVGLDVIKRIEQQRALSDARIIREVR